MVAYERFQAQPIASYPIENSGEPWSRGERVMNIL